MKDKEQPKKKLTEAEKAAWQKTRPKMTDPEEYAAIKDVYFITGNPQDEELDPIERLERFEHKLRSKQRSSR